MAGTSPIGAKLRALIVSLGVMPGLDPGIQERQHQTKSRRTKLFLPDFRAWMAGSSPAMTRSASSKALNLAPMGTSPAMTEPPHGRQTNSLVPSPAKPSTTPPISARAGKPKPAAPTRLAVARRTQAAASAPAPAPRGSRALRNSSPDDQSPIWARARRSLASASNDEAAPNCPHP
jgi:hypothetical protein